MPTANRKMWTGKLSACTCSLMRTRAGYLEHNLQTIRADPKGVNKAEFLPVDERANPLFLGSGLPLPIRKFSINGYIYGTGPLMTMKQGEHVRWYLLGLGEFFSLHTPHWHGNTVLQDGKRTDVVALLPARW